MCRIEDGCFIHQYQVLIDGATTHVESGGTFAHRGHAGKKLYAFDYVCLTEECGDFFDGLTVDTLGGDIERFNVVVAFGSDNDCAYAFYFGNEQEVDFFIGFGGDGLCEGGIRRGDDLNGILALGNGNAVKTVAVGGGPKIGTDFCIAGACGCFYWGNNDLGFADGFSCGAVFDVS